MRPGIGSHHDQGAATVELTLVLHHETDAAIRVSETGEALGAVWLPKSQIEWRRTDRAMVIEVECPEWLAQQRGLI